MTPEQHIKIGVLLLAGDARQKCTQVVLKAFFDEGLDFADILKDLYLFSLDNFSLNDKDWKQVQKHLKRAFDAAMKARSLGGNENDV